MPLVVSCTVTSRGRSSIAASTCSCVIGRSLPTSGKRCSVRRSSTAPGRQPAASSISPAAPMCSARSRSVIRLVASARHGPTVLFSISFSASAHLVTPRGSGRHDTPARNPEGEPTMSMYGAVPSELREFGLRFVAQQESVAAIQQAVFAALSSTTWVGPGPRQVRRRLEQPLQPEPRGAQVGVRGRRHRGDVAGRRARAGDGRHRRG